MVVWIARACAQGKGSSIKSQRQLPACLSSLTGIHAGFNAFFGLLMQIICGPVLPASCPESSIAPPTTGFLGGKDPSAQPFIYTSNPTGPSWVSQATPNKGGGGGQSSPPPPPSPPPPAPNSPGNSIHVGDLSDDDKVLEAVIALTGDMCAHARMHACVQFHMLMNASDQACINLIGKACMDGCMRICPELCMCRHALAAACSVLTIECNRLPRTTSFLP